jgi:hypothetical protein
MSAAVGSPVQNVTTIFDIKFSFNKIKIHFITLLLSIHNDLLRLFSWRINTIKLHFSF